jgi:long-chain acyl-CoA synthetase
MEDAEIAFAFAENQEQVDKLLEVRERARAFAHHL